MIAPSRLRVDENVPVGGQRIPAADDNVAFGGHVVGRGDDIVRAVLARDDVLLDEHIGVLSQDGGRRDGQAKGDQCGKELVHFFVLTFLF